MLPDFPEIKEELERLARDRLRQRLRYGDPVLAMVRQIRQHEGRDSIYTTVSGEEQRADYKQVMGEITINIDELIDLPIDAVMERVDAAAEDMLKQIVPSMFAKLKEVTDEVGNVVDAGGKPFSFDLFLETLEKIWIDFNEETGKPKLPTIVVSPQLAEQVKTLLPEWEQNEEYKRRFAELIERKRRQWNDRESNRKLVD
jgi:hypothetical protein